MITEDQLIEAGFQKEFKTILGKQEPTGRFVLPNFKPLPYVDMSHPATPYGRYEKAAIQTKINNQSDLIKFRQRHVPLFSEPV